MRALESLVELLRARKEKLPFEVGAFIALQAAERLLERPAVATMDTILVGDDGTVTIDDSAEASTGEGSAIGLHAVLERLLVAAGAGVPPRILEYVDHGAPRGPDALERLRDMLESSLVPLNRAASKRVIARVLRDAERESAAHASRRPPAFTEAQVDADLDALIDGGVSLAAPRAPSPSSAGAIAAAVRYPAAHHEPSPRTEPARAPDPDRFTPTPIRVPPKEVLDAGREPTGSSRISDVDLPPRKKRSALSTIAALVAALVAIAGFTAIVKPSLFGLSFDRRAPAEPEVVVQPREARPAPRAGALTVNVPSGAQVLLFVGRGPARVEQLPIGVAHELVVIADGRAPSRTVLPKDASWPAGQPRPVYELALQAGAEVAEGLSLDIGASQLTAGNMGAATGRCGDIRVVTNPPGARVFLMVGFGPQVVIRGLTVDAATELLVYASGSEPERVVVAPSDYVEGAEGFAATTTVALRPRARRR